MHAHDPASLAQKTFEPSRRRYESNSTDSLSQVSGTASECDMLLQDGLGKGKVALL
jgi:hypothetical protein